MVLSACGVMRVGMDDAKVRVDEEIRGREDVRTARNELPWAVSETSVFRPRDDVDSKARRSIQGAQTQRQVEM